MTDFEFIWSIAKYPRDKKLGRCIVLKKIDGKYERTSATSENVSRRSR